MVAVANVADTKHRQPYWRRDDSSWYTDGHCSDHETPTMHAALVEIVTTTPTKVRVAMAARHVMAAAVLFDRAAALWARLGGEVLAHLRGAARSRAGDALGELGRRARREARVHLEAHATERVPARRAARSPLVVVDDQLGAAALARTPAANELHVLVRARTQ